jgi:adenylyl-sulfate kinase
MKPHVFWLFGYSGAGKSSLAEALRRRLEAERGMRALMLDGDRLRAGLCRGLGFSAEDRTENLRRAAEVARLGLESGLVVVAAFITPLERQRRLVAETVGRERLSLVHVDAALEVCRRRDVKGLYARAAAGTVGRLTGVSDVFEAPAAPDLRIETGSEALEASAERLWRHAERVSDGG